MKDFVPLYQSVLWIGVFLVLLRVLRPEIVLLRAVVARRLADGGSIEIGPVKIGELRTEIQTVQAELDKTNERIAQLFITTMSPMMYHNLKKLASGNFGKYTMSRGLERELYHLRDIGYIEVDSIKSIPAEAENLSTYVRATVTGQQFVMLRESLLPQDRNSPSTS